MFVGTGARPVLLLDTSQASVRVTPDFCKLSSRDRSLVESDWTCMCFSSEDVYERTEEPYLAEVSWENVREAVFQVLC